MIRAHHAPNPNHAVYSADVLTAPERYVERLHSVPREAKQDRASQVHWGDVPAIRNVLEQLRGAR